jgi:CHAD domain-containing protein
MAYCFKDHETVSEGVKRIALEQLDIAIEQLQPSIKNRDEAIHDVRVSCKKLRALLRLALGTKNDPIRTHENACYRDAGKRLSDVRDTTAMIEAFDKLTTRYAHQLAPDAFSKLRKPFIKSHREQRAKRHKAMRDVARMLESARSRVTDWRIDGEDFSALRPGLKRTYKRGRIRLAQVQDTPSIANLHEWRKRVKDLGYQIRLIKPIWPETLGNLADELERLADYLSEDHDLAILRQTVHQDPSEDRTQREALVAMIDHSRAELEVEARRLGERIYMEHSSAFSHRFEVYWQTWCAETKAETMSVG